MKISKQSVELIDYMGSDLAVVNAARVSFAKESNWIYSIGETDFSEFGDVKTLSEKDQKLINYLTTHGHWSPFAHAFLSFRIKAPIFVARQLVKHQVGLSWNEVSRRYVDDEPEFFLPEAWRGKPVNAKQGSTGILDDAQPEMVISQTVGWSMTAALNTYKDLLAGGVAPEQARMVLPLNTMTEWLWSGSLMAFARVCNQRLDPHAQQECQEVAKMIYNLVPKEFEHSWSALVKTSS
jgi:thymidylate synthase (FAD)